MFKLFISLVLFFICLSLDVDVDDALGCLLLLFIIQHYINLRQRLSRTQADLKRANQQLSLLSNLSAAKTVLDKSMLTINKFVDVSTVIKIPKLQSKLALKSPQYLFKSAITPALIKPLPSIQGLRQSWQQITQHLQHLWLPFLWQNIGWLVGALFLLAGSVFLMAYSQGFNKSLVLLLSLSIYSAVVFVVTIRLAKKTAYQTLVPILLMLGLGFVPLIFAGLSRLWLHIETSLHMWISAVVSVLLLLGLSIATHTSFSYLKRSFYPRLSWIFLLLSALQLSLPWLNNTAQLPILMSLHVCLLLLLFAVVWIFQQQQLPLLFTDEKTVAWFAIGILLFAALVSFIHLSLSPVVLPSGYFGVFIMGLAALWLYSDWHIQKWAQGHVWLGKVALLVYALAVVALWASVTGGTLWLTLTALMGLILFAAMLWFYLTAAAFYALISFVSILYVLLVLQHFPHGWHFMLSLPVFLGLFWLFRWLLYRRAKALLIPVQYSLFTLISITTLWSLVWAFPGWLPMLTPLSAALLLLHIGGYQVLNLSTTVSSALRACYLSIVFAILTVAYIPLLLSSWSVQFAWLLLLFAALCLFWAYRALLQWRNNLVCRCHPSVFLHSVILTLSLSVGVVLYSANMWHGLLIAAIAGVLAFIVAAMLRIRWLLLIPALFWALAAWQFKIYIDYQPSGNGIFWAVILLWLLSFWLNHYYQNKAISFKKNHPEQAVFGKWRVNPKSYINLAHWLVPVLLPVAVLWWNIGLLYGAVLAFQGQFWDKASTFWLISLASLVLALELQRWRWFLPIALASFAWACSLSLLLPPALTTVLSLLLLVIFAPWYWKSVRAVACYFYWCGKASPMIERLLYFYILVLVSIASLSSFQTPLIFGLLLAMVLLYLGMLLHYRRWVNSILLYFFLALALLCSYVFYGLAKGIPYWQIQYFNALSLGFAYLLALSAAFDYINSHYARRVIFLTSNRLLLLLFGAMLVYFSNDRLVFWQISFLLSLFALNVWLLPIEKKSIQFMSHVRGLLIPSSLTVALFVLTTPLSLIPKIAIMVSWAFALWAIAQYLKPTDFKWSKHQSSCDYPISTAPWYWLGLLIMLSSLTVILWTDTTDFNSRTFLVWFLTILYIYLLLPIFKQAWLRHGLAILILNLGLITLLELITHQYLLTFSIFIWLNLLFALSKLNRPFVTTDISYVMRLLCRYSATLLTIALGLLWFDKFEHIAHSHFMTSSPDWELITIFSLSFVSFLHLFILRSHSLTINLLLGSALSVVYLLTAPLISFYWMSLIIVFLLWLPSIFRLHLLLIQWTRLWLSMAIITSLYLLNSSDIYQLLALTGLFSVVFIHLNRQDSIWLIPTIISILAFIHALWLPFVNHLPWFSWALQDSLLLLLLILNQRLKMVLLTLASCSWLIGFSDIWQGLDIGLIDLIIAVSGAFLLAHYHHQQTAADQRLWLQVSWWAAALMIIRYYLFAWQSPQLIDTLTLLLLAIIAVIWQRQLHPKNTDYLRLYPIILGLVALSCISLLGQLQNLQSSLTLLASASLLLFLPQRRALSLYFSMLLLNLAMYIWLPISFAQTHLIQLYLMPASITLLLFVQLQSQQLTTQRIHQLRLLALASLYSAATVDFFQQQGLLVFILALGLSLSSIIIGIALQIRAFLYTGLVFLAVFISSQLREFYPEDSLSKGLILISLGLLITITMLIFQIKRLVLIQKWQYWRDRFNHWQ